MSLSTHNFVEDEGGDDGGEDYDDDEEGEEEEEEEEGNNHRDIDDFKRILKEAIEYPFQTENETQSFEQRYFEKFELNIPGHGTLLHMLANERFLPTSPRFVGWVLQKFPNLINARDSDQKAPLHIALKNGNAEFVELVLENSPDSTLAEALEECDVTTNNNCLHEAILVKSRSIFKLIAKSSEATFIKQNNRGETPLHIAASPKYRIRGPLLFKKIGLQSSSKTAIKNSRDEPYFLQVVQSLLSHSAKSISLRNSQNQTPYRHRLELLEKNEAEGIIIQKDPIIQSMKYFCLRNFGRQNAIDILYATGKAKHIEFDLSSMPSTSISKANLERLGKHLRFEDTLQYVALPKLKVENTLRKADFVSDYLKGKSTSNILTGSTELDRIGLTDAAIVFKWLSANKVKKIIKVVVMDDGDIPHSDQIIEESLRDFKIEIWDWKKPDLCSETIFRAAKDVRVIYLYATGNNAVLRSWSCEKGLVKLRNLEQVNLIIRRGLETERRRHEELAEFEMDFMQNWKRFYGDQKPPRLDIKNRDEQMSYGSGFKTQKQPWLTHMDAFASYIANIKAHSENIKVAIIDDGIDCFQDDLSNNIMSGISFCQSPDSDDTTIPYYIPSSDHGTMIARLICRIYPKVSFYVARIEEYKASDGERFVTANSAAKSIRWAIANQVHIICMGWSIEGSSDRNDIMALGQAIEDAHRANIIILCASSDNGRSVSNSNHFPAAWTGTLTIGAATAMGDPCTWVDKTQVDFLFPGDHIALDAVEDKSKKTAKKHSGSSIAMALAAGTMALLLHIVQLVKLDTYEKMRSPQGMKAVLRNLCTGPNPLYLDAQDHFNLKFDDPAWDWDIGDGKARMASLVNRFTQQVDF